MEGFAMNQQIVSRFDSEISFPMGNMDAEDIHK